MTSKESHQDELMDAVDRPNWHAYFMRLAEAASCRSMVPTVHIGAVITNRHGTVVATGYNDFCRGIAHLKHRYTDPILKRLFTVHGEENTLAAAANAGTSLDGATIYVNSPPCTRCLNLMLQTGMSACYYLEEQRPPEKLNARDQIEADYIKTVMIERADRFMLYACKWATADKLELVITHPPTGLEVIAKHLTSPLDYKDYGVDPHKVIFL